MPTNKHLHQPTASKLVRARAADFAVPRKAEERKITGFPKEGVCDKLYSIMQCYFWLFFSPFWRFVRCCIGSQDDDDDEMHHAPISLTALVCMCGCVYVCNAETAIKQTQGERLRAASQSRNTQKDVCRCFLLLS